MNAYLLNQDADAGVNPLLGLSETGMGYQLVRIVGSPGYTHQFVPCGEYIAFNSQLLINLNEYSAFIQGADEELQPQMFATYADFLSTFRAKNTLTEVFHLPALELLTTGISLSPGGSTTPASSGPTVTWSKSTTLVVSTITSATDHFYRLCSVNPDPRFNTISGQFAPGTYFTTDKDVSFVNSGLSAVGRFALPSAFPASNMYKSTPGAGVSVYIGTSRPAFGQAGGGVEALFPSAVPGTFHISIADW